MKKIFTLLSLIALGSSAFAQTVFINEIHYDNVGTDANEGVEIAGPAGTNLTGYKIVLYNGSDGKSYAPTTTLSGTITDQQAGFGTIWFAISGIQNGAPDGIALVDASNNVIQFLSYEGAFTATDGAASGTTSVNIGVSEAGSTAEGTGKSLQLTGTGKLYTDFTWAAPATATAGAVNSGQTFSNSLSVDNNALLSNIKLKNTVVENTLSFQTKGNATVKVYNANGQLVKSATISAQNANVDVASLPKGNYVVTAELNGEKVSQKVIKK
jgi:hypothetical protein